MIIFILLIIVCVFCFSLIKNQERMKREALLEYELSSLLDEYCRDYRMNILSCDKPLLEHSIIRSITKEGKEPIEVSSSDHDFKKLIAERLVQYIERSHGLDWSMRRSLAYEIYSSSIDYLIERHYLDECEGNNRRAKFKEIMIRNFSMYDDFT